MKKLLTIVIPSYNMEKYLSRCCQSLIVAPEFMEKLEVLVINDGSKDKTSEIGHSFESKYPETFRCIDKENGNYGSCVNRGLKEAKGTYIKILDADDTFETENFAKFINYIEKWNGVDLFFSDFCMVTQKGKIKRKISYSFDSKESNPFESLLKKMNDTEYMHAVTYETENLRKINYFQTEGISYTDQEWVFLPMSVVKTFSYFPKTVYKYTVGRDGQTVSPRSYAKNMWMEIKCVKVMIKEYENGKTVFAKENLTYLTRQITFWTCHLYKLFLFIFPGLLNIRDLWEFDSWLKENSPFLYEETEKLKSSKKFFSFYFIKDFRHGKNINFMIWNSLKPLRFMYRVMRKVIKERTTEKTKSPSSKVAIQ